MERAVFAVKDFLRNLFYWRGRLSRSGYWLVWIFVLLTNIVLSRLSGIITGFFHHGILDAFFYFVRLFWNIAMYFALLFAAMRRYHDSGKPGWLALVFDGIGRLCVMGGALWLIIFFFLSAIGNIFPDDERKVYWVFGGGFLIVAVGLILCIVDILFLMRRPDSGENAYGKASPLHPAQW